MFHLVSVKVSAVSKAVIGLGAVDILGS
jgi:hypothetical protein